MNTILPTLDQVKTLFVYSIIEKDVSFYLSDFRFRETRFHDTSNVYECLLKEDKLPDAILFDLSVVKSENYLLLKTLCQDPRFKFIPLIACSVSPGIDRARLIKMGLDDCYEQLPTEDKLYNRIWFLAKYKPELLDTTLIEEEPKVEIPFWKRAFDVVFASIAIVVLSPLLLLIAILVKLESPGSIIYKSKRVGTDYQVFNFLKFRSMCQNAETKLLQLAHLNHYALVSNDTDNTGFMKIKNDPRITLVGKFIRKTSLDELPQLFNVLRGEMSIVGNRPLPLYEAEKMTRDERAARFLAPAGITGLWQVDKRGKDNLTVEERITLDVTYANKTSFWLDMKIIFNTIPAMFKQE